MFCWMKTFYVSFQWQLWMRPFIFFCRNLAVLTKSDTCFQVVQQESVWITFISNFVQQFKVLGDITSENSQLIYNKTVELRINFVLSKALRNCFKEQIKNNDELNCKRRIFRRNSTSINPWTLINNKDLTTSCWLQAVFK